MYNVLSIDIDWIQSYHHLEKLNKVFFSNVNNAKKILFGKHHHQILLDLVDHNNIVIHNIDNHHDICDHDWQMPKIIDGYGYHGCWVGSLMYENKLKEYYWHNNLDSEPVILDHFGAELITERRVKYVVDDKLNIPTMDYDLLFVCLSPEYLEEHGTSNNAAAKTGGNSYSNRCTTWIGIYQTYYDYCSLLYKSKTNRHHLCPDLPNTPIPLRVGKNTIHLENRHEHS
jgi:hypothetical protein